MFIYKQHTSHYVYDGFSNILCSWGIPKLFSFSFLQKHLDTTSLHFLSREGREPACTAVECHYFFWTISFKAKLEGLPVVIYVDARSTSNLCLVCGGSLKKAPKGHRMLRCGCGYENDRDVIACLDLLRRSPRCGELPFPPNAFYEVSKK